MNNIESLHEEVLADFLDGKISVEEYLQIVDDLRARKGEITLEEFERIKRTIEF